VHYFFQGHLDLKTCILTFADIVALKHMQSRDFSGRT